MPRNYDTTSHKPYVRTVDVHMLYPQAGLSGASVNYIERMAIVDGDGQVQHIDGSATQHIINFADIVEPAQAVDPATGADIPGKTYTRADLMMVTLAFIRQHQRTRDAAADGAQGAQQSA